MLVDVVSFWKRRFLTRNVKLDTLHDNTGIVSNHFLGVTSASQSVNSGLQPSVEKVSQ